MRPRSKPLTVLGKTSSGTSLTLPDQSKKPHMIVTGPSGSGKSRFLLSLIVQRIANRQGCTIIDPHGDLSAYLKAWCAKRPQLLETSKIHFLDADAERHSFGVNVLSVKDRTEIAAMASAFSVSMATVFGGNDPHDTPLLTSIFYSLAIALCENALSLTEADAFLFHAQQDVRGILTEGIMNDYMRAFWQNLNATRPREYIEIMGSAERRLRAFLSNESARRIFGQQNSVIDFNQIMDRGEIIILNLGNRTGNLPDETRRLLGTLFVSSLVQKAKLRRPERKPREHLLIIDECHDFITSDLSVALDQLRKFGLSVALSTQSLDFIEFENERVYKSIIANCATQICFGAHDFEIAQRLAWQFYGNQIDPDRVKRILDKPVVVGHRIRELRSTSQSATESSSRSHSKGRSSGTSGGFAQSQSRGSSTGSSHGVGHAHGTSGSHSHGASFHPTQNGLGSYDNLDTGQLASVSLGHHSGHNTASSDSHVQSESESQASAETQSFGFSNASSIQESTSSQWAQSHSSGASETLEPILSVLPTATYTLDEQAHQYARLIRGLASRHGIAKFSGQPPVQFKTLNMPDPVVARRQLGLSVSQIKASTPFLISSEAADAEIAARQATLRPSSIVKPCFDVSDDDPFA